MLPSSELSQVPDGTPIRVTWAGGSGTFKYVLSHGENGVFYAAVPGTRLMTKIDPQDKVVIW